MGKRYQTVALISAAQNFTASWADLGPEIASDNFDYLKLQLNLDVNLSNDMQVRILAKSTLGATLEFSPVVETIGSAAVAVEGAYWDVTQDADQALELMYDLKGSTEIVQVQVRALTPGGTPGQVLTAIAIVGLING
jgi:hypothetical protein